MPMKKPYTLLNHTADLRIRVTGTHLADLFKNAGLALFELIIDSDRQGSGEVIALNLSGDDPADLMVNYLRELLFLWNGNQQRVTQIDILHISNTAVSAQVTVERYVPEHDEMLHEIKAVTYHQIDVSPSKEGWQATVVLDI